jgi:alkylhydroperoxidase family enzyme
MRTLGKEGEGQTKPRPIRIAPVPPDEWGEAFAAVFSGLPASMAPPLGTEINSISIMAHHPKLADAHFAFYAYFRGGLTLSDRVRELLILRVAWIRGSEYELIRHVKNARLAGVGDDEIARIPNGSTAPGWEAVDAALLRVAEELCDACEVSDAAWSALDEHFSRQQMMDVVFVVGVYTLYCMVMNSFGVELEPGMPAFPSGG